MKFSPANRPPQKRRSAPLLVLAACAAHAALAQDPPGDGAETVTDTEAAVALPAPANWLETRISIEELAESGDFDAAAALAETLIAQATGQFGAESREVAEAHLLIADIQRRRGDYTAAEASILSAIDVHEAREGPLSPVLIEAFTELGANYDDAGDYASAISAYGEARTIGRRNFGLLNQDQLELIDDMTDAAERLGELEEARQLQLEALTLVERTYSEVSPEAIDARYKFAHWLRDQRYFDDERRLYFEIERIVSRSFEEDPIMMTRLYRERAASFRAEDNGNSLGISGLRQAVDLLEALPDRPTRLLAEVYVDIGDWNVEFQRTGGSGDGYLEAWQLLGEVEDGERLREEWFDRLTVVEIDPVSTRGLSSDPNAPIGYVEIFFTIDRTGRARDIEITASHPAGLKDSAFIRQYREARFRPRMQNGEFVSVRRGRRNEFRYVPLEGETGPG